jgi:predicted secreted protein
MRFLLCWIGTRALSEAASPGHAGIVASHLRGMTVKRTMLAATLNAAMSLLVCGAVHAAAVDLETTPAVHAYRTADIPPGARTEVAATPPPSMSELPEPEVFAMMLVGLVLIGYRASRDSSEKFKKD